VLERLRWHDGTACAELSEASATTRCGRQPT
jgi:hypothetical protein